MKAIKLLGINVVEMEFAEVKYRFKTNQIDDPARYLTSLLKKRLDELHPQLHQTNLIQNGKEQENNNSYFSQSQISLFMELRPSQIRTDEYGIDKTMSVPYSKNGIPWATFVGPDFFTLSTNKSKSDKVFAKFRTLDGQVATVPVIRGKLFPADDERGFLTVEHGRILGALENIWIQQQCRYTEFENGSVVCYCDVSIRRLAELLGWQKFGGSQLVFLKRRVMDLKVRPYYLDLDVLEEIKLAGLKGFGFTLIGDIILIDRKENNLIETFVHVKFSDTYSRQLLARRTVSRSRDLITHRSELAFLLRLYLEPILISRNGEGYEVVLNRLIKNLNLPPAKWHCYKSQRRNQFQKAVKELNGKKTIDGKAIIAYMSEAKEKNDYMLVAQLRKENEKPKIELCSGN
jgi:hypothetical protein